MKPTDIRYAFLDRLLAEVAPSMPTRRSMRSGICWRSGVAGVYHHMLVLPYVGDFREFKRYGLPIPRIHVNNFTFFGPAKAAKARWNSLGAARDGWHRSQHVLELTVALDELVHFAPWIAAWTRAVDANDPGLLLPLPHPLEFDRPPADLMRTNYAWTAAATTDYEARQAVQAAYDERRRAARMARATLLETQK